MSEPGEISYTQGIPLVDASTIAFAYVDENKFETVWKSGFRELGTVRLGGTKNKEFSHDDVAIGIIDGKITEGRAQDFAKKDLFDVHVELQAPQEPQFPLTCEMTLVDQGMAFSSPVAFTAHPDSGGMGEKNIGTTARWQKANKQGQLAFFVKHPKELAGAKFSFRANPVVPPMPR